MSYIAAQSKAYIVRAQRKERQLDSDARRVAVLIDAENASAAHAAALFEEVAKYGEANVRRLYGDVTSQRLRGWVEQLQVLAIRAEQQFSYTSGKNAADIALVIDAMDLMHGGMIDTFCLVSSDSDFTGLAQRLRENAKMVIGFGERKTPEAFRNACNRFIYVENLGPAATEEAARAAPEGPAAATAEAKKDPPSKATPLIRKAMAQLEDDEGWAMLGPLGSQLLKIEPDFDSRNYGCDKLSELVKKTGAFVLENKEGHLRVRQRRRPDQKMP